MKKRYLLLCVIWLLVPLALIFVNLRFLQMPEWVMLLVSLGAVFLAVLFYRKANGKIFSKIFVALLTALTVCISLFGGYCLPYWNNVLFRQELEYETRGFFELLTKKEALQDLDYAMKYLKKLHPMFYDGLTPEVSAQYNAVKEALQSRDEISVGDLSRLIESFFSLQKDGHTVVRGVYADNRYLKDTVEWGRNNWCLTAVNGKSIAELLEENSPYYSYEVPSWEWESLASDLTSVYGLAYLGFSVEDGIEYTCETEDGKTETIVCYDADFVTAEEYRALLGDTQEPEERFVHYEIYKDKSLAVLTLNACTFNEEYTTCLHEMFTEVSQQGIRNLAVDLRNNGGGDSRTANEFIRYLNVDSYKEGAYRQRLGIFHMGGSASTGVTENSQYVDLTFDGQVYVLTSAETFSSAMLFAQYIKDNHLGGLIGEAPGNDPNGYGDITVFVLPNSGLVMQISTKQFFRADTDCTDDLVMPDIPCDSGDAMEVLLSEIQAEAA